MTFEEATQYLFSAFPSFEKNGKVGINEGLRITQALLTHLGNPQENLAIVHVAGTNGKGSSSHFLASICQEAGYKTGLFTSPHMKSFTERIRINGIDIPEQTVIDFIVHNKQILTALKPSFFEITTALAFYYFNTEKVEMAIIETGLGGRLDSTNVIQSPLVSLITNVGWDHMDMLGNDIASIAFEKAGIIKKNIPVVLSEADDAYTDVFIRVAGSLEAPLSIASECWNVEYKGTLETLSSFDATNKRDNEIYNYKSQLLGLYQAKNLAGVLETCKVLEDKGYALKSSITAGIENVITNTNLKGRWQILSHEPFIVCDAVHNVSGWQQILAHIGAMDISCGVMVLGFSSDKNPEQFIDRIPKGIKLVFSAFDNKRSVDPSVLYDYAIQKDFEVSTALNVNEALEYAKEVLPKGSFIFVGGSIYLLSELKSI